jgi:hypothetical protein
MSNNKWYFVGPISPPPSGPGIKNLHIVNVIRDHYDVEVVDTLRYREGDTAGFLIDWLGALIWGRRFMVSLSYKGRMLMIPILWMSYLLLGTENIVIP